MAEMTEQQKEQIAKIRKKTLGAPLVRSSAIVKWDDVEIEVVKPTLAEQRAISEGAVIGTGKKAKADDIRRVVQILLVCARLPGTDFRPYTRHDIEAIEARGSDEDWTGAILDAFNGLVGEKENKPKEIEKNSEGVQTDKP